MPTRPDEKPGDTTAWYVSMRAWPKGYDLAHQAVQASVVTILNGVNPGTVLQGDHGAWYRALFAPSVQAGLLNAEDLAGYRNQPVFIRHAGPKAGQRPCAWQWR